MRDRIRTKKERDILVEVKHPFIVELIYGKIYPVYSQMQYTPLNEAPPNTVETGYKNIPVSVIRTPDI